ncbi:MAG: hypothetical protein, partial [Olavius algarvensis Gamma 1 endosymbiont]
ERAGKDARGEPHQWTAACPTVSYADTKTFSSSYLRGHRHHCVGHGARQRPPPRSPAQQHAPLPNLPL